MDWNCKEIKEIQRIAGRNKEFRIDESNQRKTAWKCRIYEAASEMWVNIMSAEVNDGQELWKAGVK